MLTFSNSNVNVIIRVTVRHEKELNACWNSVYRKLFGFHKWESVKCCIHGLNRPDLHSIIRLRSVSFYRRMVLSDRQLLSNVFWCFFLSILSQTVTF